MPYIPKAHRDHLIWWGYADDADMPQTVGELNYVLTKIINRYLDGPGGRSYTGYNAVMGVLSCIGHELYRRVIAPYEDVKIEDNGDVFNE